MHTRKHTVSTDNPRSYYRAMSSPVGYFLLKQANCLMRPADLSITAAKLCSHILSDFLYAWREAKFLCWPAFPHWVVGKENSITRKVKCFIQGMQNSWRRDFYRLSINVRALLPHIHLTIVSKTYLLHISFCLGSRGTRVIVRGLHSHQLFSRVT